MPKADCIFTPRLFLTPFSIGDADELFEIRGDPAAMAHWDWPADETRAHTLVIVRSMLADVRAGNAIYWTVRRAADARFVGLCDLSELDGSGCADLGFLFARVLWGQGYAREAIEAILAGAPGMGISSVRARVHADNARSRKLLARLGFSQTAILTDVEVRPGVKKDCHLFERVLPLW